MVSVCLTLQKERCQNNLRFFFKLNLHECKILKKSIVCKIGPSSKFLIYWGGGKATSVIVGLKKKVVYQKKELNFIHCRFDTFLHFKYISPTVKNRIISQSHLGDISPSLFDKLKAVA